MKHHRLPRHGIHRPSRPSRARGLKLAVGHYHKIEYLSRPSRARGLKLRYRCTRRGGIPVAPLAGAWLETSSSPAGMLGMLSSRPSRARGLKLWGGDDPPRNDWSRPSRARGLKPKSTPKGAAKIKSRPSRARGLKLFTTNGLHRKGFVAPLAGAWLETSSRSCRSATSSGRAPRGRVA